MVPRRPRWPANGFAAGTARRAHGLFQVYTAAVAFPAANGTYSLDTLLVPACRSSTVLNQPLEDHKGQLWMRDNCGEGGGYSHIMLPNERACLFRGDGADPAQTMIGASSNHPGVVNATMLDGSVRVIKDSITPAIWRALATYAGGEDIDPASY